MAKGAHEKCRMMVLDAFKEHLTPEIKVSIPGSSMNTDEVILPGDNLTTAGARYCEQTVQKQTKTAA
jgi:hypothetical protein